MLKQLKHNLGENKTYNTNGTMKIFSRNDKP